MGTDKPLISILMAVYEPRMDWLKEQLCSLEAQTYPNLSLHIRDDCSPTVPFNKIQACVRECIHSFPYTLKQNEYNMGSNLTFERLTRESDGDYFAYCDQDDIWLPDKLEILQNVIEAEAAQLVCSDMYIVDGNGIQIAESITKVRKHHVFQSGVGLATKFLISNFVTGCTMLIRAGTAKAAVPFCPDMVHDQYLALFSARLGKIVSLPNRLICYRIHAGNQTLAMAGVVDKESYLKLRIETLIRRLMWLKDRFYDDATLSAEINDALIWARARRENFHGNRKAKITILRYWSFSPLTSVFECIFSAASERVFLFFVALKRRDIL